MHIQDINRSMLTASHLRQGKEEEEKKSDENKRGTCKHQRVENHPEIAHRQKNHTCT
jgi:hypothetical protein